MDKDNNRPKMPYTAVINCKLSQMELINQMYLKIAEF